jgi:transposase-like protein
MNENKNENINCKYCKKENTVIKFGTYKEMPLFYCKACKRKFKADDSLFHMKVPATYVSSALAQYYSGMSFNDIRNLLKQEYNYYPSKSVLYDWVDKYTTKAVKYFDRFTPKVGDTWIADETMLDIDGNKKVWFYDIIDEKTRFLLASRVTLSRTTKDAEMLMLQAEKRAGKRPKTIRTDSNNSYLDGIEQAFGSDTEHNLGSPFTLIKENNTSLIERFHETLKDRTKVFKSFRDIETLIEFTDGFLVYYNYFKPHISLDGKTPAEMADVKYDVKNWADLARIEVKEEGGKLIYPKEDYDTERAFKRKRGHNKVKHVSKGITIMRSVRK